MFCHLVAVFSISFPRTLIILPLVVVVDGNLGVALGDHLLHGLHLLSHHSCLFNWLSIRGFRVGEVVDGNGKEDIEQDVVAADEEDDEVDADDLTPALEQGCGFRGEKGKRPRSNESAPETFDVLPPLWNRTRKKILTLDVNLSTRGVKMFSNRLASHLALKILKIPESEKMKSLLLLTSTWEVAIKMAAHFLGLQFENGPI